MRGTLYVIAAPSGTGKTTLVKTLIPSLSDITVSTSHTTRPQRPAEVDTVNYYFISKNTFEKMIDHHDFIEYATVFKHYYGTSRHWVENTLAQGKDVILEIDWQGCQQIKKMLPDCISIFILPPSLHDLEQRLKHRAQDSDEVIEQRLSDAKETLSHIKEFDYLVLNADFETAVNDIRSIIKAHRLLQKPQSARLAGLLAEFVSG